MSIAKAYSQFVDAMGEVVADVRSGEGPKDAVMRKAAVAFGVVFHEALCYENGITAEIPFSDLNVAKVLKECGLENQ